MQCLEENMEMPEQAEGYWIEPAGPLLPNRYYVFVCYYNDGCPAGPIGLCPANNVPGVQTCSQCLSGYYPNASDCMECGENDILPPILLMFAFAGPLLFGFHVATSVPLNKMHSAAITLMLQMTLLISTVLCFNVFSSVDVNWESPLKDFWQAFKIFMFNFDIFKFQVGTLQNFTELNDVRKTTVKN